MLEFIYLCYNFGQKKFNILFNIRIFSYVAEKLIFKPIWFPRMKQKLLRVIQQNVMRKSVKKKKQNALEQTRLVALYLFITYA